MMKRRYDVFNRRLQGSRWQRRRWNASRGYGGWEVEDGGISGLAWEFGGFAFPMNSGADDDGSGLEGTDAEE